MRNCCPERYGKFRMGSCFSFGYILGFRAGRGRFAPPPTGRELTTVPLISQEIVGTKALVFNQRQWKKAGHFRRIDVVSAVHYRCVMMPLARMQVFSILELSLGPISVVLMSIDLTLFLAGGQAVGRFCPPPPSPARDPILGGSRRKKRHSTRRSLT